VGLAEEFGCGDSGALCAAGPLNYDAGAFNGVLGYEEAKPGDSFLKIGVGKLIKPSDAMYSPFITYNFSEYPAWEIESTENSINMRLTASTDDGQWCFRRSTSVRVFEDNQVIMDSYVYNCGNKEFSTPHYSHNFLSFDRQPIGAAWKVTMVPNHAAILEPGAGDWSKPMGDYFTTGFGGTFMAMQEVPEGDKLKCDFVGAMNKHAANQWSAVYEDDTSSLTIESKQEGQNSDLYAYNFYVERETLSPEPFQFITVAPAESAHWIRTLSVDVRKSDVLVV